MIDKYAEKQLQYLLKRYVHSDGFPAAEAASLVLWLYGDSVESIQSLSPEEVIKTARQRMWEEAEAKWVKRRAKNKRYADRKRALKQAETQETHETAIN